MKGTLDRVRGVERAIKDAGLTIDRKVPGSHYKFYVSGNDGTKAVIVMGSSPSDTNFMRAIQRKIAKIARQPAAGASN